jgi:aldehyde dehydrogenase (NAD+)
VHEKIYDTFLQRLTEAAGKLRLGDGLKKETDVGPVVNEQQLSRISDYVQIGIGEGARIATGGQRAEEGDLARGYFFQPTVFTDVDPQMRIAREEIFGPVVALIKCSGLEEAVKIVNDVPFGLSSAIYSSNVNNTAIAERELQTGLVYINASTIGAEIQLPFGGWKHSGSGHPEAGGRGGALDFYTRVKVIYRDFSGKLQKAQITDL